MLHSRVLPLPLTAGDPFQASRARDQEMHRHAHRKGILGEERGRERRLFLSGLNEQKLTTHKHTHTPTPRLISYITLNAFSSLSLKKKNSGVILYP